MLDNDFAGIEYIDASSRDAPWGGPTIQDSLIVGHSQLASHNEPLPKGLSSCTNSGLKLPFSSRLTVQNVKMVNFDQEECVAFGKQCFFRFFFVSVI